MILLLPILLISCKDENFSDSETSLVGSWQFKSVAAEEIITASDIISKHIEQSIKNKTQKINWIFEKKGNAYGLFDESKRKFNYTTNGDYLELHSDGNLDYIYHYILNGDTLMFVVDETQKFKDEYANMEGYYNPEIVKIDIIKVTTKIIYTRE